MDYSEKWGIDVEEAVKLALIDLKVSREEVEVTVLEEPSKGFFGIGSKLAKVRVEIIKKPEEKLQPEPSKIKKENREHKKAPQKQVRKETKKEYRKENKSEEKPEIKRETELARVEDATVAECENFLRSVLHAMHMEVELHSEVDEEGALAIEMKGDNMGILIGKRGQTLDSLQYLTNRVANKMQAGYVRVKLDTEDYRRRRKETLENLAKNIAHKVKRTRKPITLEPMNPYERRIIHSALQGDKNVTTHSEGEEPYRRVVVTLVRK